MTFCEAYALYGRDSMAIAKACGITEAKAYNLMAARADRDRGVMPYAERKAREKKSKRAWYLKNKARLAEMQREGLA
ncbi:hypothetical protein [Shinella pollutisoli]|uniref:Uncharacterized protein n=1 Tax=Shinella pollutisoli TaxID=2250594 RepID=A0ABV7DBR0_9HYPH|nr:hypothetical protein [Shinella pollutisoli]